MHQSSPLRPSAEPSHADGGAAPPPASDSSAWLLDRQDSRDGDGGGSGFEPITPSSSADQHDAQLPANPDGLTRSSNLPRQDHLPDTCDSAALLSSPMLRGMSAPVATLRSWVTDLGDWIGQHRPGTLDVAAFGLGLGGGGAVGGQHGAPGVPPGLGHGLAAAPARSTAVRWAEAHAIVEQLWSGESDPMHRDVSPRLTKLYLEEPSILHAILPQVRIHISADLDI